MRSRHFAILALVAGVVLVVWYVSPTPLCDYIERVVIRDVVYQVVRDVARHIGH